MAFPTTLVSKMSPAFFGQNAQKRHFYTRHRSIRNQDDHVTLVVSLARDQSRLPFHSLACHRFVTVVA
jgi:hypothetical protein